MKEENRRSFVKKSLATSVSLSFAGLIRAHGEGEGGGTGTWNPDETTIITTTEETTTTETTVPEELISVEIRFLEEHTEVSGQSYPNTEAGKKQAIKDGILRLGQLIEQCETRNEVMGPTTGLIPCAEIEPDQGPNFPLVETEVINGLIHYKINIPGGSVWYKLLFWKPAP